MHRSLGERLWSFSIWAVVAFFVLNLLAMIGSVVVDSFGTHWFNTWLPAGFTPQWYVMAWDEFQLPDILIVTAEVVGTVVLVSGLIGVPTAYAMARRNFPGKQVVMLHLPAAAAGAADHLRHPDGDGAVPGASGRHDLGRDPCESGADGAVRDPDHDSRLWNRSIRGSKLRRGCLAPAWGGCSCRCWCRC